MHVPKNMMLIISWLSRLVSTCRVQNPNMPRASRYGAAHGGTAGLGGDGQHRTPTGLIAQGKTASFTLQTMEE